MIFGFCSCPHRKFFAQKLHNAARISEGIIEFLKLTPDGKSSVQYNNDIILFSLQVGWKKGAKKRWEN